MLVTNTQVSKIRKDFANGSTVNIKLSKTQLSKMVQLGGFLGTLAHAVLSGEAHAVKEVAKKVATKSITFATEGAIALKDATSSLAGQAAENYTRERINSCSKIFTKRRNEKSKRLW